MKVRTGRLDFLGNHVAEKVQRLLALVVHVEERARRLVALVRPAPKLGGQQVVVLLGQANEISVDVAVENNLLRVEQTHANRAARLVTANRGGVGRCHLEAADKLPSDIKVGLEFAARFLLGVLLQNILGGLETVVLALLRRRRGLENVPLANRARVRQLGHVDGKMAHKVVAAKAVPVPAADVEQAVRNVTLELAIESARQSEHTRRPTAAYAYKVKVSWYLGFRDLSTTLVCWVDATSMSGKTWRTM